MSEIVHRDTAMGILALEITEGKITRVYLPGEVPDSSTADRSVESGRAGGMSDPDRALADEAFAQLESYFAGERKEFDLPLEPEGTGFQRLVWGLLAAIPYGSTATYGQIAAAAGNPAAARAVGMANNRNPLPLFIPCHRVVGGDGSLVGYRGGLELKRRLLELERRNLSGSLA